MYKFPDYPKFSIVSLDGFCTHWEKKKTYFPLGLSDLALISPFDRHSWSAFLSPDSGPLYRTSGNWWEWPATHWLLHCQQWQDRCENTLRGWGRWLVMQLAEHKEHTLPGGGGRGVRVCLLILQSYCFALYFYFLLFSTLYHRKVIKINHSEFTWQKLQ